MQIDNSSLALHFEAIIPLTELSQDEQQSLFVGHAIGSLCSGSSIVRNENVGHFEKA